MRAVRFDVLAAVDTRRQNHDVDGFVVAVAREVAARGRVGDDERPIAVVAPHLAAQVCAPNA